MNEFEYLFAKGSFLKLCSLGHKLVYVFDGYVFKLYRTSVQMHIDRYDCLLMLLLSFKNMHVLREKRYPSNPYYDIYNLHQTK